MSQRSKQQNHQHFYEALPLVVGGMEFSAVSWRPTLRLVMYALLAIGSVLLGIAAGLWLRSGSELVARPGLVVTATNPPFALIQRAQTVASTNPQTVQLASDVVAIQSTGAAKTGPARTNMFALQPGLSAYGLQGAVGTRAVY